MVKLSWKLAVLVFVVAIVGIGFAWSWPADPYDPVIRCMVKCLQVQDPFEQHLCVLSCCPIC
jgi:hypothetical protein